MKSFKDREGRDWIIDVNVTSIRRVKALCGINLADAATDRELIQRLATDPMLLADCLYALCQQQAESRSVTDEQFGQSLAGDAIDAATAAFIEDLVDFFPKARRQPLSAAYKQIEWANGMATEKMLAAIQDPRLRERLERDIDAVIATSLSGNAPASSESTLDL